MAALLALTCLCRNFRSCLSFQTNMADVKNFLYAWCGKKKLTPNYDIRAAGNKNRQKFMCEVRSDPASPTLQVIFSLI